MEWHADGETELSVRARLYAAQIYTTGPWLQITWSGGRITLGAAAGEAGARWEVVIRAGDTVQAAISAGDGRRLYLEFHEEWIYCWAELPQPGCIPRLLVGPGAPEFNRLFSPDPTAFRRHFFSPRERAVTAVDSDKEFHGGHWFFCPPPFCFALEGDSSWLAVGVASPLKDLSFTAFEYDRSFRFCYHSPRRDFFETPRLVILPTAGDHYRALEAYCDHLREKGLAPRGTGRKQYPWWSLPNFCGWGEQSYRGCSLESFTPGKLPEGAADRCSQQLYEEMLDLLDAERIDPGVITIDDKWQQSYGLARPNRERWPDMAGFIGRQHQRGRKVLLWWKLWDGEGLPPGELLPEGEPPVVDPTSPSYLARLATEVRYALRELGADGFKIDFLHRGPTREHGPSWNGAEGALLIRSMLRAFQEAAVEAKDDCLLVAHAANPYLSDLFDMVRLNDMPCPEGVVDGVVPEMRHRARIARAACPEALIDTDNWPCPNRREWAEYLKAQPELGVPSLYYVTGIDMSGEPLRPEDYELVLECWSRWRKR
ncbi:MAG: hypothetical protein ACOX87_01680 [Chloroflexota bacterium]|jgi:hypothetical protein